jgi:hypothetical protein
MKQYDELIINGKPIKPNKYFNGEYVDARNALIPQAEKFADKHVPVVETEMQRDTWNQMFHGKMDELSSNL